MAALTRSLAVIALCALNLRTILAAIGAGGRMLEQVLGSGSGLGAASTASIALIALAAPLAVALTRRLSVRQVIAASLGGTAVAHLLLLTAQPPAIWASIVLAGFAAGLIGALLPTVIRGLTPRAPGPATAVMMVGTSLGLLLASIAVAASIEQTGDWTAGIAALAALAAVSLVLWLSAPEPRGLGRGTAAVAPSPPLRTAFSVRWVIPLTLFLGLQSLVLFAQLAWLAPTAESLGHGTLTAGQLLGVFTSLQVVSGVLAPLLAQRIRRFGILMLGASVLVAGGTGVFLAALLDAVEPEFTILAVAAGALALGHGASFALAAYVIAACSESAAASVANSGAVMLISQAIGAAGPLLFGALRDASAGFTGAWGVLAVCAIAQLGCALAAGAALRMQPRTTAARTLSA